MSSGIKTILQLWGGIFYLLNKIFFSRKERTVGQESLRWRIAAWVVYIVGLPAWLIILAHENDWMVTFVEAGGVPSMLLGLLIALRTDPKISQDRGRLARVIDHLVLIAANKKLEKYLDYFARGAATLGIGFSVYHLGGMNHLSQWAELGVTAGFLIGTYRLANDRLDGYIWFFLMNISAGILMFMQGYFWLGVQQIVSLAFVVDAYICKSRVQKQRLHIRLA